MTAPDITPICAALVALVVSMENATAPSPAATAFHREIRRMGEELLKIGSSAALTHALTFVWNQSLTKADRRDMILDEAWAGLPGWRQ